LCWLPLTTLFWLFVYPFWAVAFFYALSMEMDSGKISPAAALPTMLGFYSTAANWQVPPSIKRGALCGLPASPFLTDSVAGSPLVALALFLA
jgi:hypothetical protein